MSESKLSALQVVALRTVAGVRPPWRLTGGAALVGFYTHHRNTRDLDLFWSEVSDLALVATECERRLRKAGLRVDVLQTHPSFVRVRASGMAESVVVDLVADAPPVVGPPRRLHLEEVEIDVDSPEEILVAKLCALLGRSEIRDLADVRALLGSGLDLSSAVELAPKRDAGFSPLTLAWVLEQFPVAMLARREGTSDADAEAFDTFRVQLVGRLLALASPAPEPMPR